MNNTLVVIMAAGEGKRMKSSTAKVLSKVNFKPMIDYVLQAAGGVSDQKPVVIIGHKGEDIKAYLKDRALYAEQAEQLGTGHAVMQAADEIEKSKCDTVVILTGDAPLITAETLKKAYTHHKENGFDVTVLGAAFDDPTGYGRLLIKDGCLTGIVEHKDATEEQKNVREINAGMYFFAADKLLYALKNLTNNNAQHEYYLTDTISVIRKNGGKAGAYIVENREEISGCNNRAELSAADRIMRLRIVKKLMDDGVSVINPENTYIEDTVKIGCDTVIYPGAVLEGETEIGEGCILYPNCAIKNCKIGNNVEIKSSTLMDSSVGSDTTVGPYAYVRPNSRIGSHVKVGDFVEVKNSTVDDGTKISHLTYVGDSDVGKNVNFGCGTVTVNYDGKNKFRTTIGNNAFIGCNTNLVAPVTVGDNSFIAAGSTITDEVPEDGFAIARQRQTVKNGWVKPKDKE